MQVGLMIWIKGASCSQCSTSIRWQVA